MTESQGKTYVAYCALLDELGYAPTVRQICQQSGFSSPSTVWHHLRSLEKRGFLTWTPRGYVPNLVAPLDAGEKAS